MKPTVKIAEPADQLPEKKEIPDVFPMSEPWLDIRYVDREGHTHVTKDVLGSASFIGLGFWKLWP